MRNPLLSYLILTLQYTIVSSIIGSTPVTQEQVDLGLVSHHVVVESIGGTLNHPKVKTAVATIQN